MKTIIWMTQKSTALREQLEEEPLRLVASVVSENQHYSQVVLAEHSIATPLLESIWPLERSSEETESEWAIANYTDGRPAMGCAVNQRLVVALHHR